MKEIDYDGPWLVSPRTCQYGVTDQSKRAILKVRNIPADFTAWGIANKTEDRTIAIVPCDTSTIEYAALLAAAPELLEACILAKRHFSMKGQSLPILNVAISKARGNL
jgi:hypothetical protein